MVAYVRILLPIKLLKNFSSVWYEEAMFQIWWRSVIKWRHNFVHRRRTDKRTDGRL